MSTGDGLVTCGIMIMLGLACIAVHGFWPVILCFILFIL